MKRKNLLMTLIMSVVMLTAVILAGCGGGNTERADDALVGKYNSVAAEALGITMVGEEAGGFGIDLQSGGKGQMTLDDGTTSSLKWKNDDTTITLTIEKTDVTGELIGTDAFFAKEGSAAADPALYLPENEKALIREWKSVEASDILGDPVDPSVMAADALSMTFHGDHTMDISVAGDEYKGIDWSNLGTYGSADTDEIDISWDQEDEGLKVDYKKDGKSAVQENNATQEQIDSLASIFTINFKEGGKCEATYMSKSMTDCTYDDKKIVINGLEREYTKSGDTITFFYNDQELVVKKK